MTIKEKKSERKVQRVFLRKAEPPTGNGAAGSDTFYAIFKDDKIYRWDYMTGEWEPFWHLTHQVKED